MSSTLAENSVKTEYPVRGRPFKKGVSGNPGGRPKDILQLRELAQSKTHEAFQTLLDVMETSQSDRARIAAAIAILERGWGKAPAEIPAPTQEEDNYNSLTDEELVEELFQLMIQSHGVERVEQIAKKYYGGVETFKKT